MKMRGPTTLGFSVALSTWWHHWMRCLRRTAAVFKGMSKTVPPGNELLESMLVVIRGHIKEEVKSADFAPSKQMRPPTCAEVH